MKHIDFTMEKDGFTGHLAEPDDGSDMAVIVIMGGEQSILPGIKFAERFADFGITGLAVSLFGFMYKTFGKYKAENIACFEQSEKEIIEWIR